MTDPTPYYIPDERELLRQIADGSEAAFRELFYTYRRRLYTYLLKFTGSDQEAEDALQDIFLKIWSMRERLPTIENINAYLHRMAHNHAYHGLRRLALETAVKHTLQQQEAGDDRADQLLLSHEVKLFVAGLIDRLTPQQRKVFLLARQEGLKQEEIAERMNLGLSTVKKHMVEALRFMREEVAARYGPYAIAIYVIFSLPGY